MRIIFEEEDIECRMYIIRNSYPKDSLDFSFATTVMYKIGYTFGAKDGRKICLISMTDGMVGKFHTKKELAEKLNADKYGYRILTTIEMTDILRNAVKKSI